MAISRRDKDDKPATKGGDRQASDEEAVIRRMLNTPPQPRIRPKKKPGKRGLPGKERQLPS